MTENTMRSIPSINTVDGFNPAEFTRELMNDDGSMSLYLDVKYRMLWFRLHRPNGKIDTEIVFEYRNNALVALSNLKDIFDRYGVVSVGDLYDEAAIKCDYTCSRFGWKDYDAIHNAKVVKVKGGYMIDLPEPVEFE